MNSKALSFFSNLVKKNNIDSADVKVNKCNDFTSYDVKFIMKYVDLESKVLDLGAGTGSLVNNIYDKVKYITAVEVFKQFTDLIVKSENVKICNENILNFETEEKFDLITLFGVMHYFDSVQSEQIYRKCLFFLKYTGRLIIKQQFGLKEDVTVNGYSEELHKDYFSQYRYLKNEIKLLKKIGYNDVISYDIYPAECNRWQNTHFYALVCNKK